jgi:hypothetical protein
VTLREVLNLDTEACKMCGQWLLLFCWRVVQYLKNYVIIARQERYKMFDAAWRDWYHAKHTESWSQSGIAFENYVTSILSKVYPDFNNPDAAGIEGDWACDGMAQAGQLFFACYGQEAKMRQDDKTKSKFQSDFERAVNKWTTFSTYNFVTNAIFGVKSSEYLVEQQQKYWSAARSITIRRFTSDDLWELISRLDDMQRDIIFPGCPHSQNIELASIVPLLDRIKKENRPIVDDFEIKKVLSTKMQFNEIPKSAQIEFNRTRAFSSVIDDWFE